MYPIHKILELNNKSLINLSNIPDCCGSCIYFDGTANIHDQGSTICTKCYVEVIAFLEPCEDYRRIFEYSRIIDYCTEEVRKKLDITGCDEKCPYGTHIYRGGKKSVQACREVINKSSRNDLVIHLLRQEIKKHNETIYQLLSVEPFGAVDKEVAKIHKRIDTLNGEILEY